mmetsp:Transcript_28437/g.70435  ORF Transcript_28437/g.70435 Transcript_28437/m.70435 type:complete len:202 (-) Transcript_28437:176-781(-)
MQLCLPSLSRPARGEGTAEKACCCLRAALDWLLPPKAESCEGLRVAQEGVTMRATARMRQSPRCASLPADAPRLPSGALRAMTSEVAAISVRATQGSCEKDGETCAALCEAATMRAVATAREARCCLGLAGVRLSRSRPRCRGGLLRPPVERGSVGSFLPFPEQVRRRLAMAPPASAPRPPPLCGELPSTPAPSGRTVCPP